MNPSVLFRYLEDYGGSSGAVAVNDKERIVRIVQHPLLTFRMIYRFVRDLVLIKTVTSEVIGEEFWGELLGLIFIDWPAVEHLNEGITRLLRLSFIYDLNVDEV